VLQTESKRLILEQATTRWATTIGGEGDLGQVVESKQAGGWRGMLFESRATLALAAPIMAGFLGQMLMGIADTVMIGRVGTVPLAAAAFGHNLYNVPMVAGFGFLSAVGVRVAHAYGGQRKGAAAEVLRHGLWLALGGGLIAGLLFGWARGHYGWLRQPPEVLAEAQTYLLLIGWSMLPTFVAHALKQFSEALTRVWAPMFVLLGGVVLNVLLNWMLIFGRLGFPAMGLAGAGWATLVARVVTAVGMTLYVVRSAGLRSWLPERWWAPLDRAVWNDLLGLGTPVAVQHLLEVGAFVAAALMMGWIGPVAMAAHQIAITCAATSFMLSLGLGMAVSIRVGHAWGSQDRARLRRAGYAGLMMTTAVMTAFAVFFMFARYSIAGWFTPEREVVVVAAGMLLIAAWFQVFDGLQVVGLCALRGMTDVRAPALIAAVAYWLVALPLGYVLGFPLGQGPNGVWVGLAAGLATAAAILIVRFDGLSGAMGKGGVCVGRGGGVGISRS
jgi:multidrug resistance protein, MATE family